LVFSLGQTTWRHSAQFAKYFRWRNPFARLCLVLGALFFMSGCSGSSGSFFSSWCHPEAPCVLLYESNPSTLIATVHTPIDISAPRVEGVFPTTFSISPTTLPQGLSFDSSSGAISGIATDLSPLTEYQITGSNAKGAATTVIRIAVVDVPPSDLSYSWTPATYYQDTAITPNTPSSSGGAVTSYTINPALPLGLFLNSTTGVISGVPLMPSIYSEYEITARNSGGSTTTTLGLQVVGKASNLVFLTQPVSSVAGQPIGAVIVAKVDLLGNIVGGADPITLSLASNPWGGTLTGTLTVSATNGIAVFSNVLLTKSGSGYSLAASSSAGQDVFSSVSNSFSISPSLPVALAFDSMITETEAGSVFSPSVRVSVRDEFGNVPTTGSVNVAISISNNPSSATLWGVTNQMTVLGVATFPDLSIRKSGDDFTLAASSPGLMSVQSAAFDVRPGPGHHLAFVQQPTTVQSEAVLSPAVQVAVLDQYENRVTTSSAPIQISLGSNPGSGVLTGDTLLNANLGLVSLTNLQIDKAGVAYTLVASSDGLTSATSVHFNVEAGAASRLAFSVQPVSTVSLVSITPTVRVLIQDNAGNTVPTATNAVTLGISNNPSGGTLSGVTTRSGVAGIVQFPGIAIDRSGSAYTLSATSPGLTGATSSSFDVAPGSPAQLGFLTQPSSALSQALISPAVQVVVRDAAGNLVSTATNSITMAMGANPGGGNLSGATSVAASGGQATFSNLAIDKVGAGYTLTASAAGLTSATSDSFQISPGAAAKLAFTTSPGSTVSQTDISPAVTVQVQDSAGNLISNSTALVDLAISSNPSSGTLSGTTSRAAVAGIATFPGLRIDKAGAAYSLAASSLGLTSGLSASFSITPGSPTQLGFLQQPAASASATPILPVPQVGILDSAGNVVTTSTASVSIAILNNPSGGSLSGTTSVNAASGIASFSNLSINLGGVGYTLRATSGALTAVTSANFDILPGATKLAFSIQPPSNVSSGVNFTGSTAVQIRNDSDAVVSGATNTVALSAFSNNTCTAPATGTLTASVAAVAGTATFSSLQYVGPPGVIYLRATSSGLALGCSEAISVSQGPPASLVFSVSPPASMNLGSGASIEASVRDSWGTTLSGHTSTITVSAFADSSCTRALGGGVSGGMATATNGVASFPNFILLQPGSLFVRASNGPLQSACTAVTVSSVFANFSPTLRNAVQSSGLSNQLVAVSLSQSVNTDTQISYLISGTSTGTALTNLTTLGVLTIPAGSTSGSIPFDLNAFSSPAAPPRFLNLSLIASSNGVLPGSDASASVALSNPNSWVTALPSPSGGSGGASHACAIDNGGALYCWGLNNAGQLGLGHTVFQAAPVRVDSLQFYSKVSVGASHTCGILAAGSPLGAGTLRCWGLNSSGQLGIGSTTNQLSPVTVGAGETFSEVSAGHSHTCAIRTGGELQCWGSNSDGQIGDGSLGGSLTSPVFVSSAASFSRVSTGQFHTCGVAVGGALYCWGSNSNGQIGNNGPTTSKYTVPILINSGTSYQQVATGNSHSCAITSSNQLRCWGLNSSGQLGDGSSSQRSTPQGIDTATSYQTVAASNVSTCGISTTGVLKCWGENLSGQLGDGTTSNRSSPVIIDSGTLYSSVGLGLQFSCGLTTSNVLKCWGLNSVAQLGNSRSINQPLPRAHNLNLTELWGGGGGGPQHSCGLTSSGVLSCWGLNSSNQIGDGTSLARGAPVLIDPGQSFSRISNGATHTCAITTTGVLKCWGSNSTGQFGNGTTISSAIPLQIGTQTYSRISVGNGHTCGIRTGGELFCWGSNNWGQLGNGNTTNQSSPVRIDSTVLYQSVSLGSSHTCGITTAGVLKCWGLNNVGQLGNGNTSNQSSPVVIDGVSYQAVSLGGSHTCGITTAGVLKCWGLNSSGQLGNGSQNNQWSPTVINSGITYSSISLGSSHSCGIRSSGSALYCWGLNSSFQLGTGDSNNQSSPILIDSGVAYSQVSAGAAHTCGITTSVHGGVTKCWGADLSGTTQGGAGFGSIPTLSPEVIWSPTGF
jgi:alpha-tubulin suppressor-like RCC1 family protein